MLKKYTVLIDFRSKYTDSESIVLNQIEANKIKKFIYKVIELYTSNMCEGLWSTINDFVLNQPICDSYYFSDEDWGEEDEKNEYILGIILYCRDVEQEDN